MDLIITILPVVTKDLPISPRFTPYDFLSRCKFSTLTTRQPMVEFYLLAFPRFSLRKKEHKSYFGKNRTHDFRTSRCSGVQVTYYDSIINRPLGRLTIHYRTPVGYYKNVHLVLVLVCFLQFPGCKATSQTRIELNATI